MNLVVCKLLSCLVPPLLAANPPTVVSASQSMTSGPVLISWGPPVAGGEEVTGYTIYCTLGGMLVNASVTAGLHHVLDLGGDLPDDMIVSIRAESAQLPSELITITVTTNITITHSGSPTAGESYSLECSVRGTSDPVTFQWLEGPPDSRTPLISDGSRTINSDSSLSQLQFSTLRASHGGIYTCQATVRGVVVEGNTIVEVIRKYFHAMYISEEILSVKLILYADSQG